MNNIKIFRCKNKNSKFIGLLNKDIINGIKTLGFVFYPDSENCYWPIQSSLYELIEDGWEIVKNE